MGNQRGFAVIIRQPILVQLFNYKTTDSSKTVGKGTMTEGETKKKKFELKFLCGNSILHCFGYKNGKDVFYRKKFIVNRCSMTNQQQQPESVLCTEVVDDQRCDHRITGFHGQ